MMTTRDDSKYVVVPIDALSDEALFGCIQEFILREGTDYGVREYTLEQKHTQVKNQLQNGHAFIVFDPVEQTPSIVKKEEIRVEKL